MSNQNLSRREKAKLKSEQKVSPVSSDLIESKSSIFNAFSNNPLNLNLFDALMKAFSSDAQIAKLVSGNSVVNTCVDIIAMKVATIPLNLYRQDKTGAYVPFKGKRFSDHIFSKPNNSDTQTTFLYKLVMYFLAYGNLYLVKADNQIFVLPPTKVSPIKTGGVITSFQVSINEENSVVIPSKLVCQIFKPSLDNGYNSTVRNVVADILLNTEIIDRVANHIKSGMMAKGYLKQEGDSSTTSLSTNQLSALARQFTEATQGDKASQTIALPKGIDYKIVAQTLADSASIEFESVSGKRIVKGFKIPESIFNSEAGASYATANVQEVNFYKNTIKPICIMIEGFINYWSEVSGETQYFRFELGDMTSAEEEKMRADTKQVQASTASTLNSMKLYSANEIREASGHDKIVDINENLIIDADVNPFELGSFNADTAPQETLDANAIVKKIDITQQKLQKSLLCKCGKCDEKN